MNLKLGDSLQPPAAETVTQTLVVYGGKGMGKTNFGVVLAEELARTNRRFAVLDPVGNWPGLRHASDGKSPGVEVLVLGGKHGDLPIEPTSGSVVADLVADEDVSVVIDISRRANGSMWSLGERYRFVTDYTSRLYERQGERRRPIMQIIDEAGRFCPQLIPHGSPDIMRCVSAMERLVEEGRNQGIGVCLLTQRSARMNKSISELAECMVAFRTVGPRSIDAIVDWFGEHVPKARWKELVEKLRGLPRGEALVVSPGWLQFEGVAKIRPRWTFDTSATPTGGERRAVGRGAKPDLKKYEKRMAETVERAKLEDPKELQRELKAARAELAVAKAACGDYMKPHETLKGAINNIRQVAMTSKENAQFLMKERKAPKTVEVQVLKDAQIKRIEVSLCRWEKVNLRTLKALEAMVTAVTETRMSLQKASSLRASPPGASPPAVPKPGPGRRFEIIGDLPPGYDPGPRPARARAESASLPPAKQRILDTLAFLDNIGIDQPEKTQLGFMAGVSPSSGGFANNLSALRTAELIAYPGPGRVSLTEKARLVADAGPAIATTEELHVRIRAKIAPAKWKLIEVLIAVYPASLEKGELASRAGVSGTSGGYANNLSALRTLGLLDYPAPGYVVACPVLFLDTRS